VSILHELYEYDADKQSKQAESFWGVALVCGYIRKVLVAVVPWDSFDGGRKPFVSRRSSIGGVVDHILYGVFMLRGPSH
jgi:hypothetical protein